MEICAQLAFYYDMFKNVIKKAAGIRYATFNTRMLACALDFGCVTMVTLPLVQAFTERILPPFDPTLLTGLKDAPSAAAAFLMFIKMCQMHPVLWHRIIVLNLLQAGFIALYTIPFWFYSSSTPGKMLFAMEIRDATTLKRMTRKQAVMRFLGYFLSALPLTLGFAYALMNKKHRGFHDYFAKTVVLIKPPHDTEAPLKEVS